MASWLKKETLLSGATLAGFACVGQRLDLRAQVDDMKYI